jgi:type IV secretory pathway VirB10-like protein
MSATPNPTLSQPATAPQRAAAQKAPVRRMNRVPLFIAAGTMGLITVVGIAVAIDRAHRRTAEPPKMADPSTSEALARRLTAGRPDGAIAPKAPATPADPAQPPAAAPSSGSAQPPISRQTAAAPQGDTMEEVRKRLALQRYERLEQEKQRQELAVIQGHDEALSSPTLVDMARGSYARTADRVRNGQVPGGPLVRSGVVAAAPAARPGVVAAAPAVGSAAVRTAWASGSGGSSPSSVSPSAMNAWDSTGGEITPVPGGGYSGGGSGGTGFNGGGFGTGVGGLPPGTLTALQQAQLAPDPNGQSGKLGFLNQQTDAQGYLAHVVQQPLSPYELKKGSVIPATMITGVNSDLPGRMIAQVNQNVYDSATGRYLLIPQGSRLFGRYDANVTYGQERVLVVWTDLTFPDGSTLHLGAMAGTDQAGYGGFADRVDNHELRIYGSALLISLVGAASEYAVATARNPGVGNVSLTFGQAGVDNVSSTFGNVVRQTLQKNLNVQPTIEVRPGYRFNVMVEKDIVFPPYAP